MALVADPSGEHRCIADAAPALAGFPVCAAKDSADSILVLRAASPDLVATGVSMDGPCGGIGLCDIVPAHPHRRHGAVVVTTGRTDADRLRPIDEAGANAVLCQRCSASQLNVAVHGAMRHANPDSPEASEQCAGVPVKTATRAAFV